MLPGVKTLVALRQHLRSRLAAALAAIPAADRPGLYVVSLLVSDTDDDPRRPTIMVGYNTEARVAACTPAPGQPARWPIASSAAEARWNFAFWLQNQLDVLCAEETDPEGAELLRAWASAAGTWYSDEDEQQDFEAAMRRVEPLTGAFVHLAVEVVKDLHASGDLVRTIGRPVPVLIHELEYYEEIAVQNEEANPPGLVAEFAHWVRSS